jgi:hypothetical protein
MFTHDTRTETFLNSLGVKYEYDEAILIDELHPDWRCRNLGRKDPVDDDAVLEYAMRMESGSPAPATIVVKHPTGFEILDGVQRISAADHCNFTRFAAYKVSPRTKITTQHMIRHGANTRICGGHTPDIAWALQQAVETLFFVDDCSAEDIAQLMARRVEDVREEIRYQKTLRYVMSVGYNGRLSERGTGGKWFLSQVGLYADVSDWSMAPGPLKEMIELFDKCKFKNNSGQKEMLENFFKVNRSPKQNRAAQFGNKLKELKRDPLINNRLKSKTQTTHIDKILSQMRAAATVISRAADKGECIHDPEYARLIAETLSEMKVNLKRITPHEIEFASGRKNSSIYNK